MTSDKLRVKNRIEYLDFLRVFATFCVVVLHIAAQNWYHTEIGSYNWIVFTLYDSLTRWTVPVFLMISGSLMIDKYMSISTLYSKYIRKLLEVFIIFNLIYAIINSKSSLDFVINLIKGHYHLWYLPLAIVMYMLLPILSKIVESEQITSYMLNISTVLNIILPQLLKCLRDFGGDYLKQIVAGAQLTLNKSGITYIFGYTTYFLLGYYLHNKEINKKTRKNIYILGFVGFLTTFLLTNSISKITLVANESYRNNLTINIMLESIAIFVWFKYNMSKFSYAGEVIRRLSKYCLGIYLVHVIVIDGILYRMGLNTLAFNAIISVPIISIATMLISIIIVKIYYEIRNRITLNKFNNIESYNNNKTEGLDE